MDGKANLPTQRHVVIHLEGLITHVKVGFARTDSTQPSHHHSRHTEWRVPDLVLHLSSVGHGYFLQLWRSTSAFEEVLGRDEP